MFATMLNGRAVWLAVTTLVLQACAGESSEGDDAATGASEPMRNITPTVPAESPNASNPSPIQVPTENATPVTPMDVNGFDPTVTPGSPNEPTPGDPVDTEPVDTEVPAVEPTPETPADPVTNPPVEVGTTPGVSSTLLVPGGGPAGSGGFGASRNAQLPIAVNRDGSVVYVGYNDATAPQTGIIAASDGSVIEISDAVIGGVTTTNDGVGALLFDPGAADERRWARVVRFAADGSELFRTDLFNSPNLEDVGTKGEASTSRFGYLSATDTLVAYFGHTQRYDDGVRHQGGYLAFVNAQGEQELLNGWFGSHNLDQRLAVDADQAFVLGLGDAYPEGIFFAATSMGGRMSPVVLQPLASAGNGATNGQLGGIVNLQNELVLPFITNRSVPQDLDAGTWPDIDNAIADQIREAAGNGTDLGIMRMSKSSLAGDDTNLEVTWLEPRLADGARLERLKSAPFDSAPNILLAWSEASGNSRNATRSYYTLVLDPAGSVLSSKASLDASYAFLEGDDIVPLPSGGVVWASPQSDGIHLVTMNPE